MGDPLFSTTVPARPGGAVPLILTPAPGADPFIAGPVEGSSASSAYSLLDEIFPAPPAAQARAAAGGRLQALEREFALARRAVGDGRGEEARAAFLRALEELESPLDPGPVESPALFEVIARGGALYREALFGASALASPSDALGLLRRLNEFLRAPERFGSREAADRVQAKILKAFVIMQYNTGFAFQRQERFEEAERIVRGVIDSTEFYAVAPELLLPADALLLEILVRRYERAARQKDVRLRRRILPHLTGQATVLLANQADAPPEQREIAASYEAQVIDFLIRMQLWGVAIERARRLTTNPAYASTAGARETLAHPSLQPFVDNGRVLSPEEVRRRAPFFKAKLAGLRAALAAAGASGLKESAEVGALGALTWMAADAVADGRIDQVFAPALVAAGLSVFNRIRNGWQGETAESARITGIFDRTWEESAGDAGKLLLQGGLETGLWLVPASIGAALPEGIPLVGETLGKAYDLYGDFFGWTQRNAPSLIDPQFYAGALRDAAKRGPMGVVQLFGNLYMAGAAGQCLAYLLFPKYREALKHSAKFFVPGAVMLGAKLGMTVAGEQGYLDGGRILRSSIAVGEGLSMLLAAGVIALAGKKSPAEAFKAIGKGVWNADHNALVSAAILTGLSSAMGGEMQKVARPDDLAIVAMQGVAITVGLLPLVLGVSGIAKRNIELFDGIAAGWRDSEGENPLRRLYEATMGGADAFRTPYVFNRVLRAPTLDIPAASLRSLLGWDSNAGYGAFVGFNFFATNPTATMTFPETGGTGWERDALVGMLRRGETEKIKDHWIKAAQRIPLSHVLRPHRLSDALFAFWSIKRIVSPPLFPQMPETHYFSSLHQLITGGSIDAPELEALLSAVASLADDALAVGGSMEEQARRLMEQDVLRPILQMLAAARGHETHGGRISRFLDENGWVLDALALDPDEIPAADDKIRRRRRSKVRGIVAMPIERYDEHVREYAAQAKASEQEGPFTKRSFSGVEEFYSSVATEPNGTVELPPEELPPEIYAGGTGEGGVTTGNPADLSTVVPHPLPAQPVKAR